MNITVADEKGNVSHHSIKAKKKPDLDGEEQPPMASAGEGTEIAAEVAGTEVLPPAVRNESVTGLACGVRDAVMAPVVAECDLRVHSVMRSQHDLGVQIEHLEVELERIMAACSEQSDAFALQPYVEKLDGCKASLISVNSTLQQVQARIARWDTGDVG